MTRAAAMVLLALCAASACGHAEEPPAPPRPVLTVVIAPRTDQNRTFPGTAEPRFVTQLAFRVDGRVTRRAVSIGDRVRRGDIIATLDRQALAFGARAAEASLQAVDARRANAETNRTRQAKLLAGKAVAQATVDDANASHDTAAASVVEARARVSKAHEDLSYGVLRADSDGVITKINFEVEQTVAANAVIAEMARPDVLDVVVDVPDAIARDVKLGNPVDSHTADDPSATIPGTIRQISPEADPVTRTYRIWIELPDPPPLRLGTTMYATFSGAYASAIRVPLAALGDRDGKTFVWVVEESAVRARDIDVGPRTGADVIVNKGLRDGDRVVIAGVHGLREGQAVARDEGSK